MYMLILRFPSHEQGVELFEILEPLSDKNKVKIPSKFWEYLFNYWLTNNPLPSSFDEYNASFCFYLNSEVLTKYLHENYNGIYYTELK